jgi:hypothetical protein
VRCVSSAVTKLDEHHVYARDLRDHVVERLACARWIGLEQSLRELDLSVERGEWLA